MPEKQTPKLVYVRWIDASSMVLTEGPWFRRTDIEDEENTEIESVGWVLKENKDTIVLAAHKDMTNDCISGLMTVPRSAILWMKELKCPKKPPKKEP